jgi:hypothetical protein
MFGGWRGLRSKFKLQDLQVEVSGDFAENPMIAKGHWFPYQKGFA